MTLYRETTETDAAEAPSRRVGSYRSKAELAMRESVERWGRARWPEARVVHELVMDRGTVRADVAFVSPAHLVAVEIKSGFDDTSRLVHQAGMFRLAVPELWVCSATNHIDDIDLLAYLIPTIGIAAWGGEAKNRYTDPPEQVFDLVERRAAALFAPVPRAMLSLLWVAELVEEARRHLVLQGRGKPPTHSWLVTALSNHLTPDEQIRATCRQLRARQAFWRADRPIIEDAA